MPIIMICRLSVTLGYQTWRSTTKTPSAQRTF